MKKRFKNENIEDENYLLTAIRWLEMHCMEICKGGTGKTSAGEIEPLNGEKFKDGNLVFSPGDRVRVSGRHTLTPLKFLSKINAYRYVYY